jgi:hypothetical protein
MILFQLLFLLIFLTDVSTIIKYKKRVSAQVPMKNSLSFILVLVFLCGCSANAVQPGNPPTATIASIGIPIPTSAATVTPSPSPTPEQDFRITYEKVLTDPWNATDAEKAAFDTYITGWWRTTLKADGVADTDTLTGYALLDAIITYEQKQPIGTNETTAEQEAHVVYLPFSLHELLRTDTNDLVANHNISTTGGWDYYGLGQGDNPTLEFLLLYVKQLPEFPFYGKMVHTNDTPAAINGDIVFLFNEPGFTSSEGVGAMVRMYDTNNKPVYVEALIPLSDLAAKPGDMCVEHANRTEQYVKCGTDMKSVNAVIDYKTIQLKHLLKLIAEQRQPHVYLDSEGMGGGSPQWTDGITVIYTITPSNIPPDLFK